MNDDASKAEPLARVMLVHKTFSAEIDFKCTETLGDIRAAAAQRFGLELGKTKLLLRGREPADDQVIGDYAPGGRFATTARRIKVFVYQKTLQQPPQAGSPSPAPATSPVAQFVSKLKQFEEQVSTLEQCPTGSWSAQHAKQRLESNEHLEQMLLQLDALDVAGDARELRRGCVVQANALCQRLDDLKAKHGATAGNHAR